MYSTIFSLCVPYLIVPQGICSFGAPNKFGHASHIINVITPPTIEIISNTDTLVNAK